MTRIEHRSKKHNWETPPDLFGVINDKFRFTLDLCAEPSTAKVHSFYTEAQDAFKQSWGGTCWMNPPYGRDVSRWLQEAVIRTQAGGCAIVALVAARPGTVYWSDWVWPFADVTFITGRLRFWEDGAPARDPAPFESALLHYRARPVLRTTPGSSYRVTHWDPKSGDCLP